ncbi:heavy metal-binding domain-containing protein [uncultured Flavobacterium sp.]|uniref:YbjQ family protein n=1 Tax=uncultured Flavobacterium sp. TaxID=165435 RepID=UPI0030EED963
MILTTTNSVEDYKILEYRGIVSGNAVNAVNAQKTTMTFNMQKYYAGISESVSEVKAKAFDQLKENAENLNANAIVGIAVDIELTTTNYVAVSITGTAVSIVKR